MCKELHTYVIDHRTGALTLEEVEEDYAEDVEFLLAKLKRIEEDKDVRICTVGMTLEMGVFLDFYLVLCVCSLHG